jgi:hypothetical protein
MKSRRLRRVGHVTRVCETGDVHTGFLWADVRESGHVEDLGLNDRIILKFILKKWGGEGWTE